MDLNAEFYSLAKRVKQKIRVDQEKKVEVGLLMDVEKAAEGMREAVKISLGASEEVGLET